MVVILILRISYQILYICLYTINILHRAFSTFFQLRPPPFTLGISVRDKGQLGK